MKEEIKKLIMKAAGAKADQFSVEIPSDKKFGDYSTNVAMVLKKNPNEIAKKIKSTLFKKVEIKNGFINFFVADDVFLKRLKKVNKSFGQGKELKDKKVILDYTDPNIFKEFHIGHLMSNAIGESLSRIFEFEGAEVKRVCYQSDVGLHVAKAIWGIMKTGMDVNNMTIDVLGQAYTIGSLDYEESEEAKKAINEINKKVYDRSDPKINEIYEKGKKTSMDSFYEIYKKLGTEFDYIILESETGELGKKIVEEGLEKGIFAKGENGAIIFKGEQFGLHTRVFINFEGLPTYEAKDLGLAEIKYKKYKYDKSIIVTGNEVNEYFKVMICAMKEVNPALAGKTEHVGHGMLRLPGGKMSSRTGKVITAESLIEKVRDLIKEKIKDREFSDPLKDDIAQKVAIGAIKYSILKQAIGSDIIYDFDKSISFEGDSGPYLQYSFVRAKSVLEKAEKEGVKPSFAKVPKEIGQLEKLISYFPEAVSQANKALEPHFIVLYLTELAGAFNSYYAKNRIVDKKDALSPYKVALTKAFAAVMQNGLWLMGIQTLDKM